MKQNLLVFSLWMIPVIVTACSCGGHSSNFSLRNYDQAYEVVEVRFTSLVAADLGSHPGNGAGGAGPYYNLITGDVISSYKGELPSGLTEFRSPNNSGACGFWPDLDQHYLIYLYQGEEIDGLPRLELSVCQRQLPYAFSPRSYFSERCILEDLRDKQDLSVVQWVGPSDSLFAVQAFSGQFLNGKRHGTWQLFSPLHWFGHEREAGKLVLLLRYDQGVLLEVQALGPMPSDWVERKAKQVLRFYQRRKSSPG